MNNHLPHPPCTSDTTVGFLNVCLGGVGAAAARNYHEKYNADGCPFPQVTVQIDTDPRPAKEIHHAAFITLDARKLGAMLADPARFSDNVVAICKHITPFLNPEDIQNGSRTMRILTQLAYEFYKPTIKRTLRRALHELAHSGRMTSVIPVFYSSSGGGTGSALQILLLQAFHDEAFKSGITSGLDRFLLQTPLSFVAEPFALAHIHDDNHAAKILANAFAYRIESEWLERRGATKYCLHIGFSNSNGTLLSDPQQMSRVLGTSLYEFQRSWGELKSRFVDHVDTAAILKTGYPGCDTPEIVHRLDPEFWVTSPDNGQPKKTGETR